MSRPALPHRLRTWVRRWWVTRFAPRRRPMVRFVVPTLERLEVRLTPSSPETITINWNGQTRTAIAGEWFAHIDGLPGDTRQVQLQAAQTLLANASVRPDVQAIDHAGTDGNIVLLTPTSMDDDPKQLFAALQNVPGLQYFEPYFTDGGPQQTWYQQLDFDPMTMDGDQDVVQGGGGAVLGSTASTSGGVAPNNVTPIIGWNGIASGQSFCGCQPPDPNGAVGPNSFIETVNTSLTIYDKTTGNPIPGGGVTSFSTFFAPLGGELSFSDPVVIYNDITQKFFIGILDFNTSNQSRLDVAISKTSNPTLNPNDWNMFRYNVNDGVGSSFDFADYPKVGYNADGYMVSFNMFPNLGFFDHVSTLAIQNNGTSAGIKVVPGGFHNFTFAPAAIHDAAPGDPMWFIQDGNTGSGNNVLHVVKDTNPFSASPTFTDFSLSINSYLAPPRAQQPGGGQTLDTIDARYYFSAERNGQLVAAHTVGAGGVSRARWYDVNISGSTPTLIQEGEINPGPNVYTFFPSIDISPTGVIGLDYSQTSTTAPDGYWSMVVTARTPSDPLGTMETPVVVRQGLHHSNEFRAGDYSSLSIDPVNGTFWAVNEWADTNADNSFTWSSWVANFRGAPPAGPSVIKQTPVNAAPGEIDTLSLTFDESIDPSTFTPDKITSFTDPNGNPINVLGVTPVAGSNNTQFNVTFAPQTTLGVYTLVVGPNIEDTAGHEMDQNHNGIPGEPTDAYTATFSVQGLQVVASTPSGSILPTNVDHVRLTFNESVYPLSFTTSQLVSLTGPNGPIDLSNATIVPVAGSNFTQFDVYFAPQSATGVYDLLVGPGIQDLWGHQMDQNGNFIDGEVPGDEYDAKFTILGPKVTASTGINPGGSFLPGTVPALTVTFNEPMDPTTFTPDKVTITGPGGSFSATSVTPVAGSNNTRFTITFAATATGAYTLDVGPNIFDLFGNAMDQDGDLIPGEPTDVYELKFNVLGPRITASQTLGDAQSNLYNKVRVTFNEAMNPTTFTPDQITFTGPNGPIDLSDATITPVAGTNNTQFDITFVTQGRLGNYTMVIGPNIQDVFGNAMDQNGNLIPGEDSDTYTHRFTVFGPKVNSTSPSVVTEPISSLRVFFSKPIDVSTFTPDQISNFIGPNGPIGVTGIFAVPGSNFTQFDIDFLPQQATGKYSLIIGPGIRDLFGNQMDQNGNFIDGEVPGDQFTATFSFSGGPRVISSTSGNQLAPVDHVLLTFNEPMNPSTFILSQIDSFTGPNGPIDLSDATITPVPFTNNTQFTISFDPQTVTGRYTMVVGPDIEDLFGNDMDQNGNGIPGEVPGDQYTLSFGILGPEVVSAVQFRDSSGGIDDVRLTFNEAMDPTTFTTDQFVLTDPTGSSIAIASITPVAGTNNTQFDVSFPSQLTAGTYTLVVGPNLLDPFGNEMDQNGNLVPGEVPGDQFVYHFNPSQISLLYVGSHSTGWNDGSLAITQVSPSQFKQMSFTGFDEIWVDETVNGGDPNITARSADLASFVNAGGGLITDVATSGNYSFVPNASALQWVPNSGNDVELTALGNTHPVTAGLTDAGLSNWNFSRHTYFSVTGGMDVLATSTNTSQALILAGTFGSGHLVYFGLDPTFHWPTGQSVQLMRQAAQWAGHPVPSSDSSSVPAGGGAPGMLADPSVSGGTTPTGGNPAALDQIFSSASPGQPSQSAPLPLAVLPGLSGDSSLQVGDALDQMAVLSTLSRLSTGSVSGGGQDANVLAVASSTVSQINPVFGLSGRKGTQSVLSGSRSEQTGASDLFDA